MVTSGNDFQASHADFSFPKKCGSCITASKTGSTMDFSIPRTLHMALMWMCLNFVPVPNANHISAAGCC